MCIKSGRYEYTQLLDMLGTHSTFRVKLYKLTLVLSFRHTSTVAGFTEYRYLKTDSKTHNALRAVNKLFILNCNVELYLRFSVRDTKSMTLELAS